MKIYDFTQAPNPRRVRVFLAEKGLTVPYEQINIGTADNRNRLDGPAGRCDIKGNMIDEAVDAFHPYPA